MQDTSLSKTTKNHCDKTLNVLLLLLEELDPEQKYEIALNSFEKKILRCGPINVRGD